MNRNQLVLLHLVLSSFFLPYLLLMPLTGTLYLSGQKGSQTNEPAFTVDQPVPASVEEKEAFFRRMFEERGVDFDFEYIQENGNSLTFRPSSRNHYAATVTASGAEVHRVEPDLLKKMIELHKGHGPTLFKRFEMLFGVGLILIALSGVWLAVAAPQLRKVLGGSFALGALCFWLALIL